jgi:hypothetical protein
MTDVLLYADEYRCAIYRAAPGGGAQDDPNAPMNRPIISPLSWMDNILFHSSLGYYGVIAHGSRTISHQSVAGRTVTVGTDAYLSQLYYGQSQSFDHLLLQHDLGYVPRFFVAYDGKMIPHGMPVQSASGGVRLVCAYATATQIRLREFATSSASALPAATRAYQVLVFRSNSPDLALPMLNIEPGDVVFGQGKFRANMPHLRATGTGDNLFAQAKNRTAMIRNGAFRSYPPNGSPVDLGPFVGTMTAPNFINVAAGV